MQRHVLVIRCLESNGDITSLVMGPNSTSYQKDCEVGPDQFETYDDAMAHWAENQLTILEYVGEVTHLSVYVMRVTDSRIDLTSKTLLAFYLDTALQPLRTSLNKMSYVAEWVANQTNVDILNAAVFSIKDRIAAIQDEANTYIEQRDALIELLANNSVSSEQVSDILQHVTNGIGK